MKDCIFCKIVSGEIPCFKIYEDDFVLAFLDIENDAYGHTLVIPKKHYESLATCDGTTLSRVFDAVKKIGNHYVKDCDFDGFNVFNNTSAAAGQSVMHFHVHIIPRKENDNIIVSNRMIGKGEFNEADGKRESLTIRKNTEKTELEQVCEKLRMPQEKIVLDDENCVVLYTDGACSGNPGAGGWAAILSHKGVVRTLSGGEKDTTNNRMELLGVINGLEATEKGETVKVFSDSAYVVNAFNQNWIENWQRKGWHSASGGEVLNKELWQKLVALVKERDVEFNKVKGHSDNALNNRCDALAREEVAKLQE